MKNTAKFQRNPLKRVQFLREKVYDVLDNICQLNGMQQIEISTVYIRNSSHDKQHDFNLNFDLNFDLNFNKEVNHNETRLPD